MRKNEEKRENEWKKEKESYKTVSNSMHTQQKPGTLVASKHTHTGNAAARKNTS